MKYAGMPFGMWALFAGSFQKQLIAVLCYDADTAKAIQRFKTACGMSGDLSCLTNVLFIRKVKCCTAMASIRRMGCVALLGR